MARKVKLKVAPIFEADVYKDIARITKMDRGDIREGRICRISVNSRQKYFIVRGLQQELDGHVLIDEVSRERLGLRAGSSYDFEINEATVIGQICWACSVADPGSRVAAWIGVVSLLLGGLAVVLAVVPLIPH